MHAFDGKNAEGSGKAAVEIDKEIAAKYDATAAQIVLAWYIANPDVSVVIPGARKLEQVASNAQAMNLTLTKDEYAEIDTAFKGF